MRFLILLPLLFTLNTFAQLEIKSGPAAKQLAEYKTAGTVIANLSAAVLSTGDTVYLFGYKNTKYSRIFDWQSFSIMGISDSRQFLQLVKTMYENKNKEEEYTIKVGGDEKLNISWIEGDIHIIVSDSHGLYSTFKITKKILDKLNVL